MRLFPHGLSYFQDKKQSVNFIILTEGLARLCYISGGGGA